MKLFVDTGSLKDIQALADIGIIDGVTTNPSLLAKESGDYRQNLKQICQIVKGPVSAEVVAIDTAGMLREGRDLAKIDEHIVVKVPFTRDGVRACGTLSDEGLRVNVTLVFSAGQALLAAEAGATFVSCFMGRLDDISVDSTAVVREIVETLRPGGYTAQVLAASIRHPEHVVTAARLGCEVATLPSKVLRQMLEHPLTAAGIEKFSADWQSRPEFAAWLRGLTEARAPVA